MKKYISRLMALALVVGASAMMVACNTTKGFGEDIDSLGENMSDSAQEHGAR